MVTKKSWQVSEMTDTFEFAKIKLGFETEYVNPAYTSQICNKCNHVQGRSTKEHFVCEKCGENEITHINSAKNVNNRLGDNEIKLYTSPENVKKILVNRELNQK